jgi:hypothetical protein
LLSLEVKVVLSEMVKTTKEGTEIPIDAKQEVGLEVNAEKPK